MNDEPTTPPRTRSRTRCPDPDVEPRRGAGAADDRSRSDPALAPAGAIPLRLRAAWRAGRIDPALAGLEAVPAVVRGDAGNDQQLVLGLIENLQRTDLDPIEEARGLRRLIEEFGLTHDETAQRLGKHRVSVTQSLRLLGGCPAVQSAVAAGVITAGHARALIALEGQAVQEHGLKVVIAKHLSVRQTENWVRTYRPRRRRHGDTSAELRAIAADVESSLGVPIKLTGSLSRGKLELRYSSREELERVCAKLVS
ncbi:MAG: ParB/RepB/Spo0J family partition protein [Chloroflexi bacterium]|nr:MAG: ParB/RepB/Spo0J family partition protein [Chloroflexota bacterium]